MSYTAKHFQEPLLRVLGRLSQFTSAPVAGDDTYDPVMALMGITDINAFGEEASSGQPLVQRWIQWACKNLRKSGHVDLAKRGHWALTPTGVLEARRLDAETTDPDEDHPTEEEPVMNAQPVVVQTPATVLSRGPLDDPYILNLILEKAECLGHYTPHQGAVCVGCSVQRECRLRQYARYAQVAAEFARLPVGGSTASAPAPAPVAQPVASAPAAKPEAQAPAPAAKSLDNQDMSNAQVIQAFEETVCCKCDQKIRKGSTCYWLEDPKTQESFIFHDQCPEDDE